MTTSSKKRDLTWKPNLIYIPSPSGTDGHFRGGDQEILPLSEVGNPELLRCIVDTFKLHPHITRTVVNAACAKIASNDTELDTMLATLIEQRCIIESDLFDYQNKLHRLLLQHDIYSDALVEKIKATKLYVWSRHTDSAQIIKQAQDYGFNCTVGDCEPIAKPDAIIAFGSFVSDQLFAQINNYALQTKLPWILLRQSGMDLAQIGPLFTPPTTGCYHCLQQRMASQREHAVYFAEFQQQQQDELVNLWLESDFAPCVDRLLNELVYYVVHPFALSLVGKSVYRNLITHAEQREGLLRLPNCPQCK